jgi:hypothetical protein
VTFPNTGLWTGLKKIRQANACGCYPIHSWMNGHRFTTTEKSNVTLDVFNINGQLINRLADSKLAAGTHEIRWDGTSSSGFKVSEGLYIYRLQTGNDIYTGRIMQAR